MPSAFKRKKTALDRSVCLTHTVYKTAGHLADKEGALIMLKRLGMTSMSGALLLTAGCLQKETSLPSTSRRMAPSRG